MRAAWILAVLAVVTQALPAHAAQPLQLAPSSYWNLDISDEKCTIARRFGEGDDTILLMLTKFAPGTAIEVVVAGKPLKSSGGDLKFRFAPQDDMIAPWKPLFGELDNGATAWEFQSGLIPSQAFAEDAPDRQKSLQGWLALELRYAGEIESFDILGGVEQKVSLKSSTFAKAAEALNACTYDMVRAWGYDPDQQLALQAPAKPKTSPGNWIRPSDYAVKMSREGLSADVHFRLDIDAQGKIAKCTIQGNNSDPAFSAELCKTLNAKAQFDPAIDANGKPTASYWVTSVKFLSLAN